MQVLTILIQISDNILARTGTITSPGRVSSRLRGLPPDHPEGIQEEDEIEAEKLVKKVNGKSAPKKKKSKAHKVN